jgi:hypothetical protein
MKIGTTTINYKKNYWEELSAQELQILIGIYKKRIKTLCHEYGKKVNAETDDYRKEFLDSSTVEELTKDIMILMDIKTPIYLEECIGISRKFHHDYDWYKNHGNYSNELLSTVIVAVILNHYNVKYDTNQLIDLYSVNRLRFFRLYSIVNDWCNDVYWKN